MDYGALSLLPPLVAIVLAVTFRQVIVPLLLAILCGSAILQGFSDGPIRFATGTLSRFAVEIWTSITGYDHLRALTFSLLLGGMVGVLEAGGGMVMLVEQMSRKVRSRRGAQTLIASLGLGIFFDDYANTLLVGGTMRTTADKYGISRAKLAYLVDTTSAPVAGLSPISTWVVTEISYVAAGLTAASILDVSPFALLVASIPFRFYPILALVMVFAIAISDRDFGPMRKQRPNPPQPTHTPETTSATNPKGKPNTKLGWAAIIPIIGCVSGVLASLFVSGSEAIALESMHWFKHLGNILSSGDSYGALIHGGGLGLILAIVLHRMLHGPSTIQLLQGALAGAAQMLPAMMILWLAWALSAQTDSGQLNTGGFIAGLLSERVSPTLLPTCVFLISAGVAFSTGTSWGTMAILTPIAMHLGITIAGGDPYDPISIATLGSVLAGAIFGDHCSPISDTTVLSSRASGCDHITHVRTQMPYAVSVGVTSILLGSIPVTLGFSPYLCLAAGSITVIGLVMLLGKSPATD